MKQLLTQIVGLIFSVPLRPYGFSLLVIHKRENQPAKHNNKIMTCPMLIQACVSSALYTETNKTRAFVKSVDNTEKQMQLRIHVLPRGGSLSSYFAWDHLFGHVLSLGAPELL